MERGESCFPVSMKMSAMCEWQRQVHKIGDRNEISQFSDAYYFCSCCLLAESCSKLAVRCSVFSARHSAGPPVCSSEQVTCSRWNSTVQAIHSQNLNSCGQFGEKKLKYKRGRSHGRDGVSSAPRRSRSRKRMNSTNCEREGERCGLQDKSIKIKWTVYHRREHIEEKENRCTALTIKINHTFCTFLRNTQYMYSAVMMWCCDAVMLCSTQLILFCTAHN